MVVKRALPFSSRFTPDAAPIGRSGFFSSAGASVFSAQSFSAVEGCRPSKTSLPGDSATPGVLFLSFSVGILPSQHLSFGDFGQTKNDRRCCDRNQPTSPGRTALALRVER